MSKALHGSRVAAWNATRSCQRLALAACGAACLAGCWQSAPSVMAPSIDAGSATKQAFELYDANHDGLLDAEELVACPGVLASLTHYDTNGDRKIDQVEFAARMQAWKNSPAMMSVDCRVTLDGRVLAGAEVKYVPEPYLVHWLHEGVGVTNPDGATGIGIAAEFLPPKLSRVRAMHAGVYKVQITHPTTKIPEVYNTKTTLGREVSTETKSPFENFVLKSQ